MRRTTDHASSLLPALRKQLRRRTTALPGSHPAQTGCPACRTITRTAYCAECGSKTVSLAAAAPTVVPPAGPLAPVRTPAVRLRGRPSGRRRPVNWLLVLSTVGGVLLSGLALVAVVILLLVPGLAAVSLAVIAFDLHLALPRTVALSLSVSLGGLLCLWGMSGFNAQRAGLLFGFVSLCASVSFALLRVASPEIFAALAHQLGR